MSCPVLSAVTLELRFLKFLPDLQSHLISLWCVSTCEVNQCTLDTHPCSQLLVCGLFSLSCSFCSCLSWLNFEHFLQKIMFCTSQQKLPSANFSTNSLPLCNNYFIAYGPLTSTSGEGKVHQLKELLKKLVLGVIRCFAKEDLLIRSVTQATFSCHIDFPSCSRVPYMTWSEPHV